MGLNLTGRKSIKDALGDFALGAGRQINFLDNGKTFKNTQGNGQNRSALAQLGTVVADQTIRPAVAAGVGIGTGIVNATRGSNRSSSQLLGNDDRILNFATNNRPSTNLGQGQVLFGNLVTTGSNLIPGAGTAASRVAGKVIGREADSLAARTIANSAAGALTGVTGNTGAYLAEGQPITTKGLAASAATGALFGGVIGGAAPVAGTAIKKTAKAVNDLPEDGYVQVGREQQPNTPATFDANSYIKQQTKAQADAFNGERPTVKQRVLDAKTEFKTKLIDSMSPIEDTINKATNNQKDIAPSKQFSQQVDRALRSDYIAEQYRVDNGFDDIIKQTDNPRALSQYLIARQAADVERAGIKTGRDLNADSNLVNSLSSRYEAQAQAVNAYSQKLLDETVNYGLISPQTAAYLKQKFPNYVPLERIFSESELEAAYKGTGSGKASISQQSVVQRLKGSSRTIDDPLEAMVRKTSDVVAQGERNLAAQRLIEFESLPGNPFELRKMKSTETVGTKPVISALIDGKQVRYETLPFVAAAAKSLNREQVGLIGKILNVGTRILRLGATSANPAFALANLAKDTVGAAINSSSPYRSLLDPEVIKFAWSAAINPNGAAYGELRRAGAAGTSFDIARNQVSGSVKKIRSQRSLTTSALYTVTRPAELLRAIEDAIGRTETLTRAAQYAGNKKSAQLSGLSEADASVVGAIEARKNSANFSRAGEYGRVLNAVLPYLNAGIQGARSYVNAVKNRPVQTLAKTAVLAMLPAGSVTAWNLSDPDRKKAYDSISDYEKETNLIIIPNNPTKDASGRWNVIKIPIAPGTSGFHNVVRKTTEQQMSDGSITAKDILGAASQTVTSIDASNPGKIAASLVPQGVKPAAESMLNQNFFTGQQIVPDAIKNLDAKDQYTDNTSGTAKVVGRLLNQSPLKVDNAIRTATGGLGQNLINISDRALASTGAIKQEEVKGKGFGTSIANRFNSAQGISDGALYFKTLQEQARNNKIAGSDYSQLNSITSKALDQNGQPRLLNDNDDLERNQILRSSPNIAKVLSDTAKEVARKNNKPVDPLYNLDAQKQYQIYDLKSLPYKGEDYQLALQKMPWYDGFQKERSDYFKKINSNKSSAVGASPQTQNDKVKFPTFSDRTQQLLDQSSAIDDPSQRVKFIQDNPEIQDAYDRLSQYTNDKRIATGRTAFKGYPKADSDTQKIIDEYNALPKKDGPSGGNATRSAWIKANPDRYAKMQNFFTQTAVYQLANNAGLAKFEGQELNQKALKSAYSLGNYSIAKIENPDGSFTYTLDPSSTYQVKGRQFGGSGGGSRSSGRSSGSTPRLGSFTARSRRGGSTRVGVSRIKRRRLSGKIRKTTRAKGTLKTSSVKLNG